MLSVPQDLRAPRVTTSLHPASAMTWVQHYSHSSRNKRATSCLDGSVTPFRPRRNTGQAECACTTRGCGQALVVSSPENSTGHLTNPQRPVQCARRACTCSTMECRTPTAQPENSFTTSARRDGALEYSGDKRNSNS
ncbi:hypothetical protein B566_EDAN007778 [Ephemera danica]|nr:hypothetical protein B566_EDAN007778 [Ephemera danica]